VSITLSWALSLLINNPDTLKKAQEEVDFHVGKERKVEESDVSKLVYLHSILKETLRLRPSFPLNVPHEATEDMTIGGYDVPAGTLVMFNLWKMHRDPRIWKDPEVFRPDRFLNDNAGIDLKGQHYELIPFGAGRRMCPGVTMALQIVHFAIARFLQGFDVVTPSGNPVDMTMSKNLTGAKPTPVEVLLKPRLPSSLY
jgi:fraxetin 5-hydroxylase